MLGMVVGGGEIWDIEMARQLENKGVKVTFFTGTPLSQSAKFRYDDEPFTVEFIRTPHLQEYALAAPMGIGGLLSDLDRQIFRRRLKRQLSEKFEVIHINSRPSFLRLSEEFKIPMTIKMNGPPHSLIRDYLLPGASSYDHFEQADAIVGTGETPNLITRQTGLSVHTINPGVDTETFDSSGKKADFGDGPSLLWVGRFVPAKDLPLLIKSVNKLVSLIPNVSVYLIGNGPKHMKIKRLVKKYGLTENIDFLGRIDHKNLPKYYRSADVFTLTSRTENHPIALMEAMSCETPAVVPDVGWIPEMITDGDDGLIVDSRSPAAFAAAWESLLIDQSTHTRYGSRARETARARFEWSNRANKLLGIFKEVCEK
jgi:glycosyltransferase involved in cell wall biosynthesis